MKDPFNFDISAAKDKARRKTRSRGQSGAFETSTRVCEHSGCDSPGKYRAPKSATQMDEFKWFCLPHVREYNQKWNFFEAADYNDIEEQERKDAIGERPTKPMNSEEAKAWARMGFEDPYEVLRDKATQRREDARSKMISRYTANERRALEILGAQEDITKSGLRKLYKSLVKDLHPDRNSGSRADEERLNEVVWAWSQVKDSRNFPN